MGEVAGHSGGAGARIGRWFARRLGADDHRSRSAEAGPAVRAVPQPRARVDARLRHRFLRNPARRGDPPRPGKVRARSCRPDNHLRKTEGPRRAEGPRPRPSDELWAGGKARQANPHTPNPTEARTPTT